MRRIAVLSALPLLAVGVLAGCGSSSNSSSSAAAVSVSGSFGKAPDVTIPAAKASSDSYAAAVLLDGSFTGHPNQALDTACTLYLADIGDHMQ